MNITAPCVVPDLKIEDYHAHPSISKSGLWTLYTKTPAHYRFGERTENRNFAFGNAAHCAITQPEEFEGLYLRGPDNRRGNAWKDGQKQAGLCGFQLLTSDEYDTALRLRDVAGKHPILHRLASETTQIEQSAFWHDLETKVMCRCRPDILVPSMGLCVDLKTTTDASPRAFAKSVYEYGYHVQEAFYTDGWNQVWEASGNNPSPLIDAWLFVAIEKAAPYQIAVYELPPDVIEEGRAICRKALRTFSACLAKDEWPGYPATVQELEFQPWMFRENRPNG